MQRVVSAPEKRQPIPLTELKPGQRAVISAAPRVKVFVASKDPYRKPTHELLDLGLEPGTIVEVEKKEGGMVEFHIVGTCKRIGEGLLPYR